jgi:RNA polymerase sigma-32 factor
MDSRLSGPDASLNVPVRESEGSSDRQDFLVDGVPLPDETVTETIDGERRRIWLRSALNVLSERELRIVNERRLQDEGTTLEALGESLGISKERVRQIENRALAKLREALLRDHPDQATFV